MLHRRFEQGVVADAVVQRVNAGERPFLRGVIKSCVILAHFWCALLIR